MPGTYLLPLAGRHQHARPVRRSLRGDADLAAQVRAIDRLGRKYGQEACKASEASRIMALKWAALSGLQLMLQLLQMRRLAAMLVCRCQFRNELPGS